MTFSYFCERTKMLSEYYGLSYENSASRILAWDVIKPWLQFSVLIYQRDNIVLH